MSQAAYEELILGVDEYLESDDGEEKDDEEEIGIFNFSRITIEDALGSYEFKNIYNTLIPDIKNKPFELKRIFCQKMLDKIFDLYDYQFPESIDIVSDGDIARFLEFLEFLEFDNVMFLSLVWQVLKVDIMKTNIETMCKKNENIIIDETEDQLGTHHQGELITIFLRTYSKENFIEWFIRESQRNQIFIKLEILEREGKLNGQNSN